MSESSEHSEHSEHSKPILVECKRCRKYKNLSEFFTPPSGRNKHGTDVYCKICRAEYGKLRYGRKKIQKAMEFWKRLSSDPLANELNRYFPGFASFKDHVCPVPSHTYAYFLKFSSRSWKYYQIAFNLLYAYPFIGVTKSIWDCNSFLEYTYEIPPDVLIQKEDLYHEGFGPIGINDIRKNLYKIRKVTKFLIREKKCRKCRIVKPTFILKETRKPPTNEQYISLILTVFGYEKTKPKRSGLIDFGEFFLSYQSEDFYSRKCRKCLASSGPLPTSFTPSEQSEQSEPSNHFQ